MILTNGIPFYMQITRILRNEIIDQHYHVNQKFPDEIELANRFGVSKDVIRVSLRLLANEGLLVRIRSKGTFVSDKLVQKEHLHVMLTACQNPLGQNMIHQGIEAGIGKLNYDIIVKNIGYNNIIAEAEYFEKIDLSRFAAMVITAAVDSNDNDNSELFNKLLKHGIPLVFIDHELKNVAADAVYFDEFCSTQEMAKDTLEKCGGGKLAVLTSGKPNRIVRDRNLALNTVLKTISSSKDVMVVDIDDESDDHEKNAEKFCSAIYEADFQPEVILLSGSVIGWEIFKRMRMDGRHHQLKAIGAVCDGLWGDEEYNRLLNGYYRLYDEFVPSLTEILLRRLDRHVPTSVPMVKKVKFRPMSYTHAAQYFAEACIPQVKY